MSGRRVVMEDDEPTPITQEFPEEPPIELSEEDIVDVLLLWAPIRGSA